MISSFPTYILLFTRLPPSRPLYLPIDYVPSICQSYPQSVYLSISLSVWLHVCLIIVWLYIYQSELDCPVFLLKTSVLAPCIIISSRFDHIVWAIVGARFRRRSTYFLFFFSFIFLFFVFKDSVQPRPVYELVVLLEGIKLFPTHQKYGYKDLKCAPQGPPKVKAHPKLPFDVSTFIGLEDMIITFAEL